MKKAHPLEEYPVVRAAARLIHESLYTAGCRNASHSTLWDRNSGTLCRHHREYVHTPGMPYFSLAFYDDSVVLEWSEGGTGEFFYNEPDFQEQVVAYMEAGRHCIRVREGM